MVVISGGGNDLDGASGSGTLPNKQAYVDTYTKWLVAIRGNHFKALITALLNPAASGTDRPTLAATIGQAVAQAKARLNNDGDVIYLDFFADAQKKWYSDAARAVNLGYAYQCHPSVASSDLLADCLAKFIAGRLGC